MVLQTLQAEGLNRQIWPWKKTWLKPECQWLFTAYAGLLLSMTAHIQAGCRLLPLHAAEARS